jgi:hypothetical protein
MRLASGRSSRSCGSFHQRVHLTPIFRSSPLPMSKVHPRRSPRQQAQRPRCPSCGKRFINVLRHLNHRQSKCAGWFEAASPQYRPSSHSYQDLLNPTDSLAPEYIFDPERSPSPSLPDHQPHVQSAKFPGAAKTYGRTKSFMDKFNDDRYSSFRTTNLYYPFSGKNEWELASFLLSSGLSMRKIDEFLQLRMVILPASRLATVN